MADVQWFVTSLSFPVSGQESRTAVGFDMAIVFIVGRFLLSQKASLSKYGKAAAFANRLTTRNNGRRGASGGNGRRICALPALSREFAPFLPVGGPRVDSGDVSRRPIPSAICGHPRASYTKTHHREIKTTSYPSTVDRRRDKEILVSIPFYL